MINEEDLAFETAEPKETAQHCILELASRVDHLLQRLNKLLSAQPGTATVSPDSYKQVLESFYAIEPVHSMSMLEKMADFNQILQKNITKLHEDAPGLYQIYLSKKKYLFPDFVFASHVTLYNHLIQAANLQYPLALRALADTILRKHIFKPDKTNIEWALDCLVYLNDCLMDDENEQLSLEDDIKETRKWLFDTSDLYDIPPKNSTDYRNFVSLICCQSKAASKDEYRDQQMILAFIETDVPLLEQKNHYYIPRFKMLDLQTKPLDVENESCSCQQSLSTQELTPFYSTAKKSSARSPSFFHDLGMMESPESELNNEQESGCNLETLTLNGI